MKVSGLYLIIDLPVLEVRQIPLSMFGRAAVRCDVGVVQLRAKGMRRAAVEAAVSSLRPLCRARGVPLVLNDDPELASATGCDGVHVGQGDCPVTDVQRLFPALGVGVSTHSLPQLEAALRVRPAYVALGPVFATQTKPDAEPTVGLAVLRAASELTREAGTPLVAIGGIAIPNLSAVAPFADAFAVISAALPEGHPSERAVERRVSELARAFAEAKGYTAS